MSARGLLGALLMAAVAAAAAPGDLAEAAKRGQWAEVRALLSAKADARFVQPDGMTALHWAVQANQEEIVGALLNAGADPKAANRYGITPLWLAATNGSATVARVLLKAGASATATLPHGETALMAAARTGEPDTLRVLLEAGSDPNAKESSQGETALMWAAAENHPDAIRALIKGGADPNVHGKALDLAPMQWMQVGMVDTILARGGFTALMYAARQDAKAAVLALTESGADLNARDPDGTTAIQFAIMNQHYDLAALLLERGADSNVADNTGMTAVYAAVDMNTFRSDIGRPPRLLLDKLGALDVVRLALAHGGNPNAQLRKPIIGRHHGFGDGSLGEGATALMRAVKGPDLEAMQVLLEGGANPSLGMANGSTPLQLLAGTRVGPGPGVADKVMQALRLLAKHGAKLNQANQRGETALHTAARQGSNAIVRALVELGADLNATDSSGKTALDLVAVPGRGGHEDTAALLRELTAKSAKQ
ncbi:MAG: ankyrin repeat domain-containing protein [Acidobacteriota bacterium]